MKKLTILFSLLLTAVIAQAQITLLRTLSGSHVGTSSQVDYNGYLITDDDVYFHYNSNYNVDTLYDAATWQIVQVVNIPANHKAVIVAKNVFTSDNSYSVLCYSSEQVNNVYRLHFYVYDATGNTLIDDLGEIYFPYSGLEGNVYIAKFSFGYQLILSGYSDATKTNWVSKIYSLPGQGSSSSVVEQAAPSASRGRKYMHENQVMIQHADKIYHVDGKMVR